MTTRPEYPPDRITVSPDGYAVAEWDEPALQHVLKLPEGYHVTDDEGRLAVELVLEWMDG